MKSIKSPAAWPGVILAVSWIFLSLGAFVGLFQLYGFRWYSIILLVSCHLAFAVGAEFNNHRRERFAREHGLHVSYGANVLGHGKFFSGYRNKAGKHSHDGAELID